MDETREPNAGEAARPADLARYLLRFAVGIGALFSGAALLGNIIIGIPLPITLGVMLAVVAAGLALLLWRARPEQRRRIGRVALIGVAAGIMATLVYDAAKVGLSQLDPSPYNPFEATRIFGELLIGTEAPLPALLVTGAAFHFLNGTMFGLAYTSLFARPWRGIAYALLSGVAWGLFLETFQYMLYPDWLGITLVDEFARISALSHVAYGASLGLLARWMLRRRGVSAAIDHVSS